MPTRSYSLEAGGPKRLTLSWGVLWSDFTVTLDGAVLARLTAEAVKAGHDVPLPEGAVLHVKVNQGFANAGLSLTRDGVPLEGAANHPDTPMHHAAYVLYALAVLNTALGVLAMARQGEALEQTGAGVVTAIVGLLFGVAGFFAHRGSLFALLAGTALYAGDTVQVLLGRGIAGTLVLRVVLLALLAKGVLSRLRRDEASATK